MKNKHTILVAVIAFAFGAFLPYLNLNSKIKEMNSKMDGLMEYVNSTNDRIDYVFLRSNELMHSVNSYHGDVWDQKLYRLEVVEVEEDKQVSNQVETTY